MMIPYQALLTPLYLMFSKLGLANTHVGLAIVHTLLQLPFSVYLMRHAFEAVPKQLEEAAVIDGCDIFQVLLARAPAGGEGRHRHGRRCSPSSPRGTSSSRR